MALSKERQDYHLTPDGWVEGSFQGDVVGGANEVPISPYRVLTISCYDVIPAPFSEPYFYDRVVWESPDKQLVAKLKEEWGDRPDWFGYEKMKKNKS